MNIQKNISEKTSKLKNTDHLFNRDLSWLSFNERVLQEAKDPSVPLYEKLKFIAIFSSNLDEFFRVRVASLRSILDLKKASQKELDFDPARLLKNIHAKVFTMQEEYGRIFREIILPELNRNNIFLLNEKELSEKQKEFAVNFFNENVQPLTNPVILDKERVIPFLKSGTLYLAIQLFPKDLPHLKRYGRYRRHSYALVEIPSEKINRFIRLTSREKRFDIIFLDDIIRLCLPGLFPGYEIISSYSIKLTRDAEIYIDDEFSGNLPDKIQKAIKKRSTGAPSRFLYDGNISSNFLKLVKRALNLTSEDLVPGARYHNFNDFFEFPNPGKKEFLYEPLTRIKVPGLENPKNIFSELEKREFLLYFPYHKYDYVVNTVKEASADPFVTEIKLTQYRVAKNSEIVKALVAALKNGKAVTVFVELKARFDEESNMVHATELENAGANVLYSLPGLKVHGKVALIKKNVDGEVKNYVYLSTGNFNEVTAKLYTDFGFFTTDKSITKEVEEFFSLLEGKNKQPEFNELLVSKFNMRGKLNDLIENEIKNAKNGMKAKIMLKLNSIEDQRIIEKLYDASRAGVRVQIIVRGICCLIPGNKKFSDKIKAVSIIDKFLEHARAYYFYNNGNEQIYLASADWMKRNLSRRLEIAFPVKNEIFKELIKDILKLQWKDNVKARIIDKKQINEYKAGEDGKEKTRSQEEIYNYLKKAT